MHNRYYLYTYYMALIPPTKLQIANHHIRDDRIVFDEGPHKYYIDGDDGSNYTSVTTWVHSHFEHFDPVPIIKNILKGKKWGTDPEYKYYKKTAEEIKKMWAKNGLEASTAGTLTHYNIECYYNDVPQQDDSIEYKYFLQFAKDHPHLKPYRTEWCVFYEDLKLSGSIDMVFYNTETEKYCIYDWKRVKEIKMDNAYQRKYAKTECINSLPDTNYWHYTLQLNIYSRILKEKYNIETTELCLVVLHPDSDTYEKVPVNFIHDSMDKLWAHRKEQLKENI